MEELEFIEIHWTCGSIDEARKISRYLVQERLVACSQIIPWVESIYLWDNKLETTQESKITFKALAIHFEEIKQIILDNCQYEIPEITFTILNGGSRDYLNWISETSKK